ncbi:hypothetical protein L0128_13090 [candidate division KSB1 bacterium]|nr:hypothetical protein [candidate division KSB1 bacterium]
MATLSQAFFWEQIKIGLEQRTKSYPDELQQWIKNIQPNHAFGYNPFGLPISLALTEAFLYRTEGNIDAARRARTHLVNYREFMAYYPRDYHTSRIEYAGGIPPIPSMFTLWQYALAYQWIRTSPVLSPADHRTIEAIVADSMPPFFHFPEWGAHNRTILRALSLALAAQAFPAHPGAADWAQMARTLAADSLQHWSIEDAMSYHGIWWHALLWYADVQQLPDFYRHPIPHFYFEYFKQLLTPAGTLVDFGDSNWDSSLTLYLACFLRGAKEYRDPTLQFAAQTILTTLSQKFKPLPLGDTLIAAYLWLDESLPAIEPISRSGEVLDELVGKKIVFRNGWQPNATFLFLNYKPETDFGTTPREYLKNTLSVEAEKAHHGHSDENSIGLLMHNGSVLLHDGGYREQLPNGKYRADYYHNRIVFREKALSPQTPIMDFLQYDGKHQPVETAKIDFLTFQEVEMSRTRVLNRAQGFQWDRTVIYLKTCDWFLLFDWIHFLPNWVASESRSITLSNLFFTQKILAQGENYFDTRLEQLLDYPVSDNAALLIYWPGHQPDRGCGSQPTRRYYEPEIAVHQSISKIIRPDDAVVFVTALIPHAPGADVSAFLKTVRLAPVDRFPDAAGVEIQAPDQKITVGVKLNLEAEILQPNVRPRYQWDSGKTRYGMATTDARFCYCREQSSRLVYAFSEAVRLDYGAQTIFTAKPAAFPLQYTGPETQIGISKWRAWEGEVVLPRTQ